MVRLGRRRRAAAVRGTLILLLLLAALLGPAPPWRGRAPTTADARGSGPCGPARTLSPAVPPLRGSDVMELQERLKDLGLYGGPLDGVYDPDTVEAVRALQRRRGAPPTGEVTDVTWRLLADPPRVQAPAREGPPPEGSIAIDVDLATQKLTVLVNGRPYRRFTVAIGKPWSPSPPGEWKIVEKAYERGGAFGTRWLGLDVPWGGYGIHGTNRPWSIGSPASAGCIRMFNEDVEAIFDWIPVGTPVTVRGDLPSELWGTYRSGSVGLGVVSLQMRLREAGFSAGRADGRFGERTAEAVRALQTFYGLPADGEAGLSELYLLNLKRPGGERQSRGGPRPGRPFGGGGVRLGRSR